MSFVWVLYIAAVMGSLCVNAMQAHRYSTQMRRDSHEWAQLLFLVFAEGSFYALAGFWLWRHS